MPETKKAALFRTAFKLGVEGHSDVERIYPRFDVPGHSTREDERKRWARKTDQNPKLVVLVACSYPNQFYP